MIGERRATIGAIIVFRMTRVMAALRTREIAPIKGVMIKMRGRANSQPASITRIDRITNMCRYGTEATMKASVSEAFCARGEAAQSVIMAELQSMTTRRVWTVVHSHSLSYTEQSRVIRSSMFLKEKFLPIGEFNSDGPQHEEKSRR
jgi:hypothetical protein